MYKFTLLLPLTSRKATFALLFLTLLCTCGSAQLLAQNSLSGTITDQATGDPLPFASIYVQETQSGSASNADGQFSVRLAPGRNTVVFQYLGYQTLVQATSGGRLNIKMNSEALELGEVEVISGGEDISYSVIRRAIAKADFHLNQVEKYTADVYIKGTGKVKKIGGLIRTLAGKEGREEIDENIERPFTTESTSVVTYERPNKYTQEVKQVYSIGEEQFNAANYVFTTFYQPLIAEAVVSPLNPKAFGYYKFEHQGAFLDRDKLINKIKVIPRSPGEDVFSGTIYIVQDDWSIHSLDLTTPKIGFDIRVKQNYAEVLEHNWMPITTTINVDGGILGIKFEYNYLSTIGNYDIQLNPELKGYIEVIDEKTQPEIAARTPKKRSVSELEETLGNGGEITRKDLRRLMKNYDKEERKESDEPEVLSNFTFTDSTAVAVRDSVDWAKIRPVPLTTEEIRGYEIADSVIKVRVAESAGEELDGEDGRDGNDRDTTKRKFRPFRRQSLLPDPFFNPVEGYALGATATWGNQSKAFGFTLHPRYAFTWKRGTFDVDAFIGKSGIKPGFGETAVPLFKLSGGRSLRQFNDSPSIDPWLSTYFNLFNGNNFIRLYERAYGQLEYRKAYSDELSVHATLAYEDRRALTNNTNQSWFGLDEEEVYEANSPVNGSLGRVTEVNDAATIDVAVRYRPGLKYNLRNGKKELIADSAPTIGLRVRQGVPDLGNSVADFTEIQASYETRFDIGRKGKAQLLARGGTFLNNSFVDFPDFRHFEGSEVTLVAADPLGSYRLLPYYLESTREEYLEVYAHYQFRKLLLTQITAVHLFGLKEDLFVNYLYTPTSDHYTELGYSLDNIFRFMRLEFVTSFRDGKYEEFGVRIGVSTSLSNLGFE